MSIRALGFGFGVVLLLGLGAGGYQFRRQRDATAASTDKSPSTPTVPVHVVLPTQGGVTRKVMRPGTIRPYAYARLFTKVSGYLQHQKVDIGSQVKEHELLAELYAPELEADVRKAEADLAKAKAQVDVATARVMSYQAELEQAQAKKEQALADVESAKATHTLREREYKRISSLAREKAVTEELVDEKEQARKAAAAKERSAVQAVATAASGIAAARANLKQAQAELEDARAQVGVARATLDRARTYQQYTQIQSPYTGLVIQRGYHDGDFIRASGGHEETPVLTVARTDWMRVVVWVPDPDVPLTQAGRPATLRVDALQGREFHGKVARTAGAEDPSSRTMRTEIDLPNQDNVLKDGMYGQVTIDLGKTTTGVTIPAAALGATSKNGERSVFVVRNGRAHHVQVKVGRNDGIRAEIVEGMRPDDEIIVSSAPGLTDGARVTVVEGKESH